MNSTPIDTVDTNLDQLLKRNDIWRGDSRAFVPQLTVDSGYSEINASLLNGGWPARSLIEICQRRLNQQEWMLFLPILKAVVGNIVLLNPPVAPFCQALIQSGVNLERLIVVQITNKADLLASFVELARTESCEVLLAWQQHHAFTYTELRKCLLAANESTGLCLLFRPESAQQQSSPSGLRLLAEVTSTQVQIRIFKQKGILQQRQAITLPLPKAWKGLLSYHLLDQTPLSEHSDTPPAKRKLAPVVSLMRGKR